MNITINRDDVCWVCGHGPSPAKKKGNTPARTMTMHHTLPKHLNPKRNVVVPVCNWCHEEINAADFRGVLNFTFKIQRACEETIDQVKKVREYLATHDVAELIKQERRMKNEARAREKIKEKQGDTYGSKEAE